jgi:hypothetical protein
LKGRASQLSIGKGLQSATSVLSGALNTSDVEKNAPPRRPFWRRAFSDGGVDKSASSQVTPKLESPTLIAPPKASEKSGEIDESGYSTRRQSLDDTGFLAPQDDRPIVTAGKLLKDAILHDARNIKRKDVWTTTALNWDVSSSHEAKV